MTDSIIEPAPAYTSEVPPPSPLQEQQARRIKNLQKTLRLINNIADPIQQSIAIEQQYLSPQLQIIVRTSQLINLALIMKAVMKCGLDDEYGEIDNPSPSLQASIIAGHQSIDTLIKMCVDSLSETINFVQHTTHQPNA